MAMLDAFDIEFVPESARGRLDQLYRSALAAASSEGAAQRVGDDSAASELSAEYEAFKAEVVVVVRARPLVRSEWKELKALHPPRAEGDEDTVKRDRIFGLNVHAVEDDLVYRALVDPEFKSRAAFDEWADAQPPGVFSTIFARVWEATTESRTDPKSLPASPTPRSAAN